jgi:hypothetical protein
VPVSLLQTLQALLSKLTVDDAVLGSIRKAFPAGSLLIARSSANVEDLAGGSWQGCGVAW